MLAPLRFLEVDLARDVDARVGELALKASASCWRITPGIVPTGTRDPFAWCASYSKRSLRSSFGPTVMLPFMM